MKFKTVLEGEQAVIFNHLGEGNLVVGPARMLKLKVGLKVYAKTSNKNSIGADTFRLKVFLFRERLQKLKRHTASQYEYLKVRDKDGVVTHKRGPCEVFFNPMVHDQINVVDALKLDANHMVVVYNRMKDGTVQRRIIQGPTVFVPEAEEWLHEFKWHGTDPENKARMVPGKDKFHQLACIPEQFYYNVRDVRTNDDTMITVKLMLFYELKDVLKMLDATHDPIADMINAMCADVIAFVGKQSFEQFLQSSHLLSQLPSYPQLMQRGDRIGYEIQKIVFRGYHSSEQLQAMQNSAIESRTQLRLNTEIEEQRQKLADLKVTKEQERTKLRQDMDKSKQLHKQRKEELMQAHKLEIEQLRHLQSLNIQGLNTKAKLDLKSHEDNHKIEHLSRLKDLDIDLTAFLTYQQPPQVTEEVQVIS